MKRLFVTILMLVVVVVGVGFLRGWFTVDEDKIHQDEKKAKEEIRELVQEVKAKAGGRAEKPKEPQP